MDATITETLEREQTIPKFSPTREATGKTMHPRSFALSHPAAPMLDSWGRQGCPVDCGKPWSKQHITAALKRGPHVSALTPNAIASLREETRQKIDNGCARVVRWGDIKHKPPTQLKMSPVAMVPHKSRQFRTILDLLFSLRYKGGAIPAVNDSTTRQAPAESMVQLGNCIRRIVSTMANNCDPQQPFAFAKIDIKDGFWRMMVSPEDAWNFCYALPSPEPLASLDDVQIVVPSSLQMGWCESPPFFCAATETARDVTHHLLQSTTSLPHHRFENKMLENSKTLARLHTAAFTTNLLEVFVDDFCAIANDLSTNNLQKFSRALITGMHSIFPPPEITQHQGEDPMSQKKMTQGEATWDTTKELLGWLIDGINCTIQLTPERCQKTVKQIRTILKK